MATIFAFLLLAPAVGAMGYGVDLKGHQDARDAGWSPGYGQFWIGKWSANNWGYLDGSLEAAKGRGVIPVIEWYYWGDAISPSCVQYGCQGMSQSQWNSMGAEMARRVRSSMGDRPVIIVVETEFNKNGVQSWEAFDGILANHIAMIQRIAPNAQIALGFGNWGSHEWGRFDRAMAASDYAGLQLMRGTTKDSWSAYQRGPDELLSGARTMQSIHKKPIIVHDIALASYHALDLQNQVMKGLRDRRASLEDAGVFALVYREARDYKDACTCWYYGAAERTFGLKYAGGSAKPAWWTWVGMAKSGTTTLPGASTVTSAATVTTGGFSASFTPKNGNEWWIQTSVDGSKAIAGVDARVNGGTWVPLDHKSYGWARSVHVPTGSTVEFRARATDGTSVVSPQYQWPTGTPIGAATSGLSATFSPYNGNAWWVQTKVSASKPLAGVDARVNGGAWTALDEKSWGAWAKSIHAPYGSAVEFRAKAIDGTMAYSAKYIWPK